MTNTALSGFDLPEKTGFDFIDEALDTAIRSQRYGALAHVTNQVIEFAQDNSSYLKPLHALAAVLVQKEYYRTDAMKALGYALDLAPRGDFRRQVAEDILKVQDNLKATSDVIVATYISAALHFWPDRDKEKIAAAHFDRNVRMLDSQSSRVNAYISAGVRALPGSELERVTILGFEEEMKGLISSRYVKEYEFIARTSLPPDYSAGQGFRNMAVKKLLEETTEIADAPRLLDLYNVILMCTERDSETHIDVRNKRDRLLPPARQELGGNRVKGASSDIPRPGII